MINFFRSLHWKWFGKVKVSSSPSNRNSETWGYIHLAEIRLKMKLKSSVKVEYKLGRLNSKGLAFLPCPYSGEERGGWTYPNKKEWEPIKSVMVTYPDGRLGPRTGKHEAARWVIGSNGIWDEPQDKLMKERGLW